MEAICSSETSVDTQLTTRRYIPEVDTLQDIKDSAFSSLSLNLDFNSDIFFYNVYISDLFILYKIYSSN
jgi:hypothetical protein